jgi:GNAT superfamily N-acetyltransferase
MAAETTNVWEARDPADPGVVAARHLYEALIDPAERIPWEWIEGAVGSVHRRGDWRSHLLLAGDADAPEGFAYGSLVPGLGGYISYLAVTPSRRRRGAGTALLRGMIDALRADAARAGESLPFVLWESRPATADGVWEARLRLFARVGAWHISGLTFQAPSFAAPPAGPVPLQLFLVPVDRPAESFDARALRAVAAGLMTRVYRRRPGDPLYERTLPPDCRPELRPVRPGA